MALDKTPEMESLTPAERAAMKGRASSGTLAVILMAAPLPEALAVLMSAGPRNSRSTPSIAAIFSHSSSASTVSIWIATNDSRLDCSANFAAGIVANRASQPAVFRPR